MTSLTHPDLSLFVVDDDEGVRDGLGMLLLSRGHRVQTFASGEQFRGPVRNVVAIRVRLAADRPGSLR